MPCTALQPWAAPRRRCRAVLLTPQLTWRGLVCREPEEERWDPRPATPDLDEPPAEASAGLKGGSEDDTRQVQSAALLLISRCHLAVLLIFSDNLPQVIRLRHHARYAWPVNELVLLAFSHCASAAVLSVIVHG